MHLCRHLAKYRHIVSDPNGRVPKSSIYHNNNYAQFLRRRFSAFQFLPRTAIMISRTSTYHKNPPFQNNPNYFEPFLCYRWLQSK